VSGPQLVVSADDVEGRVRESQRRFGFERYTTRWQDVIAGFVALS
jgi:hypothetical protein